MKKWTKKNIFWSTLMTILAVACFPVNPLVLTGVLETGSYPALFIVGWVVWTFGMVLVIAPIIIFRRRGGFARGKSLLFGVLGAIGAVVVYLSAREEDQRLVQQFGGDYIRYMQKVPRMNIFAGFVRLLRRRRREMRNGS